MAIIGVLLAGMAIVQGVGAFEIGENCIENSGFEACDVGATPEVWRLKIVG